MTIPCISTLSRVYQRVIFYGSEEHRSVLISGWHIKVVPWWKKNRVVTPHFLCRNVASVFSSVNFRECIIIFSYYISNEPDSAFLSFIILIISSQLSFVEQNEVRLRTFHYILRRIPIWRETNAWNKAWASVVNHKKWWVAPFFSPFFFSEESANIEFSFSSEMSI